MPGEKLGDLDPVVKRLRERDTLDLGDFDGRKPRTTEAKLTNMMMHWRGDDRIQIEHSAVTRETIVTGPCCQCEKGLELRFAGESPRVEELVRRGKRNMLLCGDCKRALDNPGVASCGMRECTDPDHQWPKQHGKVQAMIKGWGEGHLRNFSIVFLLIAGCAKEVPPRVVPPDECHMQIEANCDLNLVCGAPLRVFPWFACLAKAGANASQWTEK